MERLAFAILFLFCAHTLGQELFGLDRSRNHKVTAMAVSDSKDSDVKAAVEQGLLSDEETEHSEITFKDRYLGNWKLQVFQNKTYPNGPTFFVPHDNENEAFLTGAWAIAQFGGHLISWECAEARECDKGVDPNRHFRKQNFTYISTIMAFYWSKRYPVITLHNNHDSHYRLGGRGAIYADLEAPYSDGRGYYNSGDPDDLIIYADTESHDRSVVFNTFNQLFHYAGLNSIFEHITAQNYLGGHMSTYVIQNSNLQYFNVEAQHGHYGEQKMILSLLLDIVGIYRR